MRLITRPLITLVVFAALARTAQAQEHPFPVGAMDVGPTVGLGNIGSAGIAFGGRFERGIRTMPQFGGGTLGIQASVDIWQYNNSFVGVDYDFRYIALGVTANYHFPIKSNPKLDPFVGLGLGNSSVSTDFTGSYSSGIYFIGRAGVRYYYKPRLALYADAGAGAATINVGAMFSIGKK